MFKVVCFLRLDMMTLLALPSAVDKTELPAHGGCRTQPELQQLNVMQFLCRLKRHFCQLLAAENCDKVLFALWSSSADRQWMPSTDGQLSKKGANTFLEFASSSCSLLRFAAASVAL